jgi:hypothetical protein
MKRIFSWQILLAFLLIILSAFFYCIHYWIFRDIHHIFLYLIGDIAFLFVDVLIVMLVLHRLLEYREKQSVLKKLNMVIGTFFSEVGTDLLQKCSQFDPEIETLDRQLIVTKNWSEKDFAQARKAIQAHPRPVSSKKGNLKELKIFLVGKRPFLLVLLENPNLLEHESFTNLLWAVFHLTDELAHRPEVSQLPDADYEHISGDIKRAYQHLILQWLDYMQHLKRDYPYLFSLAMRTNPFDRNTTVEIQDNS